MLKRHKVFFSSNQDLQFFFFKCRLCDATASGKERGRVGPYMSGGLRGYALKYYTSFAV